MLRHPTHCSLLTSSILAGVYEKTLDRESAYEKLAGHAEARIQQAQAKPGSTAVKAAVPGGGLLDSLGQLLGGGSGKRTSAGEQFFKSAASSIGRELGRQISRGVLGGIFGGKR